MNPGKEASHGCVILGFGPEVQAVFDGVRTAQSRQVRVGNDTITIPTPFPSPQDWRDHWIYFLMIDRFNNPTVGPASTRQNPAVGFDQPSVNFKEVRSTA